MRKRLPFSVRLPSWGVLPEGARYCRIASDGIFQYDIEPYRGTDRAITGRLALYVTREPGGHREYLGKSKALPPLQTRAKEHYRAAAWLLAFRKRRNTWQVARRRKQKEGRDWWE